jgi:hypothetical protein
LVRLVEVAAGVDQPVAQCAFNFFGERSSPAAARGGPCPATVVFFEKIMDLSLPIFTLFSSPFCMKCIAFTTRTYNFKNLAVGSVCVA